MNSSKQSAPSNLALSSQKTQQETTMNSQTTNQNTARAASLKLALLTPAVAAFLMACGTPAVPDGKTPAGSTVTPQPGTPQPSTPTSDSSAADKAEVDRYLKALPSWSQFSPTKPNSNTSLDGVLDLPIYKVPAVFDPIPINIKAPVVKAPVAAPIRTQGLRDSLITSPIIAAPIARDVLYLPKKRSYNETFEGVTYDCTSTPYDITRTPEKIVTLNPDVKALWPGGLLQGQGYVNGLGSLLELPIRQRAPMMVTTNLQFAGNSKLVQAPDLASMNSAVGAIIGDAKAKNVTVGGLISFNQTESHSSEQSLLELGLSARYIASTLKASFGYKSKVNEHSIMASFFQNAYTVSVVTPQTPADFFTAEFTPEKLEEQVKLGRMGPNNLPVYVSSINYGRIVLFRMTSKAKESEMNAALNAMYQGGTFEVGGNLSFEQKKMLSEARLEIVTVGASQADAEAAIRSGNLKSLFSGTTPVDTFRPISYEVRNLGDDSIAKVSESTTYNVRECRAVPPAPKPPVVVGAKVKITLNSIKILDDGEDGDGGQMIGDVFLNGRTLWHAEKNFATQLQSGNFMQFAYATDDRDVRFDNPGSFRIQGAIDDYDALSANDKVGRYDLNINPFQYGTFTVRSDPDSSDGASELTYTVEKLFDLTEPAK